jgi:ribosomal protein S24E
MKTKIVLEKDNPLLKRKEVHFQVKHDETGSTPPRLEVRKAVASALKAKPNLVFVKRLETKTGTHTAVGLANVYESMDQARLVESDYIIKRNIPPEKPKTEEEE